jgi:hypothetical protein
MYFEYQNEIELKRTLFKEMNKWKTKFYYLWFKLKLTKKIKTAIQDHRKHIYYFHFKRNVLADLWQSPGENPGFHGSQIQYHCCIAKYIIGNLDTLHRLMLKVHAVSKNGSVPFAGLSWRRRSHSLWPFPPEAYGRSRFWTFLGFLAPELENIPKASHGYKIRFNYLIISIFY